ncbi:MAG: inositol monophosphatase family protein [Ilumatobacteraceae bacterium]
MTSPRAATSGDAPGHSLGHELVALARDLARRAGRTALEGRRSGALRNVTTKTTGTDMVTEFDRRGEELIVTELRRQRPHDAIVGEEGANHPGSSGITWYVDPIDGTTSFLYDLPTWCVSIGAGDAHGPLAGAVYIPALDEMFWAVRGAGARLNDAPIRCNTDVDVSRALCATGFSYSAAHRTVQMRRVAEFIDKIRDIRRSGAAAIDLCFVACGRVDAYFEENLHSWDLAAGELIAREAGAVSGDYAGGPLRPDEVLVAGPSIFADLSGLLVAAARRHPHT